MSTQQDMENDLQAKGRSEGGCKTLGQEHQQVPHICRIQVYHDVDCQSERILQAADSALSVFFVALAKLFLGLGALAPERQ